MERLPRYIHSSNGELWLTESERDNLKISYRLKSVIVEETSPIQHVMVVDSHDFGTMLVLDGVVQTTSIDGHIYNEMIAHVPLSMHPSPRNVLIIGGGDLGAAREAAKYEEIERIDLVEIDETVVRVCMRHMPEVSGGEPDPRVRFHFQDGVQFVKTVQEAYDVIIVDSSDPIGPAEQLFQYSFYRDIYRALKPDGMMVCQSQSPIFHRPVMSDTYRRIASLFPHCAMFTAVVPTYPGGLWSFTLGSKRKLPKPEEIRFDKEARYCSAELIRSSFALPAFLKRSLETIAVSDQA